MKKNDIAVLVLIVAISLVVAFFIAKALIGQPKATTAQVEKVDPISASITQPDPTIFNKDAIDPAVVIQIGNTSNQQPFNGQ